MPLQVQAKQNLWWSILQIQQVQGFEGCSSWSMRDRSYGCLSYCRQCRSSGNHSLGVGGAEVLGSLGPAWLPVQLPGLSSSRSGLCSCKTKIVFWSCRPGSAAQRRKEVHAGVPRICLASGKTEDYFQNTGMGCGVRGWRGGVIPMVPRSTLASDRPADAVSSSMESMVVSALRVYFCLYSDNSYHIKTYMLIIYKDTIWKKG